MAIRPEDVLLRPDALDGPNTLPSKVARMEYRGANFRLSLNLGPDRLPLEAEVPAEKVRRFDIRPDMHLAVELPRERLRVYAAA